MTLRPPASRAEKARGSSIENLLCAALALGLFVTSLGAEAFGGSSSYRTGGLLVVGCLIGVTLILGLAPRGPRQGSGPRRNVLVLLAAGYFGWAGAQDYFLQSDLSGAVQSLIGFLVVCGALAADIHRVIVGLRRWFVVLLVAFLVPALMGQGYEVGERVWFSFLPGRYFGFSNANALSYVAGIAILLAVPVLRQPRGRWLVLLGGFLLVITAGNTTAVALGVAILAYVGFGKVRKVGALTFGVRLLAIATPVMLLWLRTDGAVSTLANLQARFDLSGRSFLWVSLVRLTRNSDSFWLGLGDEKVAYHTAALLDVYSAHSTILQVFLGGGFLTAVLFVLAAASATIRLLNDWASERTSDQRIALAIILYWFIVSLTSTQPGTGLGFSLVIVLAVAQCSTPVARIEAMERMSRGRPSLSAGGSRRAVPATRS